MVFDVRVIDGRGVEMRAMLDGVIIPRVKGFPGFVSGQWLRAPEGDALRVVQIYDSGSTRRRSPTRSLPRARPRARQ